MPRVCDIALKWTWVPIWANLADDPHETSRMKVGMHYCQSFRPPPTAVFASLHALSKLDLLREPLSTAAQTAGERVRKLESSGVFSCSKMKLAYVENETSQMAYLGENNSTP